MIKSIKTLSLPVPTRSENFNLFFQSLQRAFLTKKINDEFKSEILINLLGERAHNVLLYIKEEELNDYEKLKFIVLREIQLTPRECLNSFKNAVKSSGETYIQFAARLTANFQYYCSLRKVNSFESLCDLIISDKLYETLNKETATHIGIREAEDWVRPIDLAKECDIYISSRSGSRAHAYAYSSAISFPNVSVSNVIENSSYDLPYVKNFNTRNDSSSLIKDYKCNKIKITKLKLSIVREKCSDIVLCKKANGAMKTSSVEFISRSPNPLPMKNSPLVSMEVPLRTAYGQNGRCGMQPKAKHSLRAQAQLMRTETVETFELVKVEQKLLREKRGTREVREQALPSEYHRQTYL
ncbi:uncharacterized protein TNCV_98841 [Trichonephila clavipes]|nr:uncharacterized protein TNCV_98841 [Trichonephila clavipes]